MRGILILALGSLGIAGAASPPTSFFALYEENRRQAIPNHITEDFLLLGYGLTLDNAVTDYELKVAAPALERLVAGLLDSPAAQGGAPAAKSNRRFLSVLECLLTGKSAADQAVSAELKLIHEAGGIARSPIMSQQADYTQLKVRGKYTRSGALGAYFRATRYANLILFPVLESASTGISAADANRLTRQAMLLIAALSGDAGLRADYEKLSKGFDLLFGPADDLVAADYVPYLGAADTARVRAALFALKKRPRILGGVVDTAKLEAGRTAEDVLTGFRFLPSRFSPDVAAFQELVYPRLTGALQGNGRPFTSGSVNGKLTKTFPRSLEIFGLLGVRAASDRLKADGDQSYAGYDAAWNKARAQLWQPGGLGADQLGLLASWAAKGKDERLETAVSAWTRIRYSAILYAKQSYTEIPKGMPAAATDRKTASIGRSPELYAGLAALSLKAAAETGSSNLRALADVLLQCAAVAGKTTLSAADADFLNSLDLRLYELTGGGDEPIVVDVHTDLNSSQALEEGLGWPRAAEVQVDGAAHRGAWFRHYEFKQPMDRRLTDEEWQKKPHHDDLESAARTAIPADALTAPVSPSFTGGDVKPVLGPMPVGPSEDEQPASAGPKPARTRPAPTKAGPPKKEGKKEK